MIDIPLGQVLKRAEVHDRYKGNPRGGISPLAHHPAVLLFSNPNNGEKHGYQDAWGTDGCFHYSGEGQVGDQQMKNGNRAILRHKEDGRELHLFRSPRRSFVERVGRFEVDEDEPWYSVDAPDSNGDVRRMIVFRLRRLAETLPPSGQLIEEPPTDPEVEYVPLERHTATAFPVKGNKSGHVAERREAALLKKYGRHLAAQGHSVSRNRIKPPGERQALLTDLFDATDNVLVEAKGNVTREAIRMAVGQLFDYQRHIKPRPKLAVLLPDEPRADLLDFCAAMNIATIWEADESFTTHAPEGA